MSNVIPIKPAGRATEEQFQIKRPTQRYACPKCGETCEATVMFVVAYIHCDGCGAEMRPMEAK